MFRNYLRAYYVRAMNFIKRCFRNAARNCVGHIFVHGNHFSTLIFIICDGDGGIKHVPQQAFYAANFYLGAHSKAATVKECVDTMAPLFYL